jgi:hypothetical protein
VRQPCANATRNAVSGYSTAPRCALSLQRVGVLQVPAQVRLRLPGRTTLRNAVCQAPLVSYGVVTAAEDGCVFRPQVC